MSNLYSILEVSENLGIDVNNLFNFLRDKNIKLEKGKISESSLNQIKKALETKVEKEEEIKKRPEEKISKKHNPSAIHQYIHYEELEAFTELMEELGEDLTKMPRSSVFGGLVTLIKDGIIDRWFENYSLENAVKDFYPLKIENSIISDNVWLVGGAETYRNWNEEEKEQIKGLIDDSKDDLSFTYNMKDVDGDLTISASAFLMGIEKKRFFGPEVLERFKWLANGLLLYKNLDNGLKEDIVNAYEESHKRVIEFSHWLFDNRILEQIQENVDIKIKDDNSYIAAILFTIKDKYPSFNLNLGTQQTFGRQYAAFRRMLGFKEKGDSFNIALKRIKKDLKLSKKNEKKIDVDLFITNTIKNGTYKYFYENYCGRGIQYSTFGVYAAAALLMESKDNPENELYGGILSKLSKERRIEKVDRLRGKSENGQTCLVDLCKEYPDHTTLHKELEENWGKYKKNLFEEGCWIGKPRKNPFTQKEVKEMYELVEKFPDLFERKS